MHHFIPGNWVSYESGSGENSGEDREESEDEPVAEPVCIPQTRTRSGRTVKFNAIYEDFI